VTRLWTPPHNPAGRRSEIGRRCDTMNYRIHTEADLDAAVSSLVKIDGRFENALAICGRPPLRPSRGWFCRPRLDRDSPTGVDRERKSDLERFSTAFDPIAPAAILRARTEKLARSGLSAPKIRTLKALARAITREEIDLTSLVHRPADDAHRMLTAIHASAMDCRHLSVVLSRPCRCLAGGRPALQEAVRLVLRREARPTAREMGPLAETWRPWRGAAAYVLWAYYGAWKRRVAAAKPSIDSQEPTNPKRARPMGKRDGR